MRPRFFLSVATLVIIALGLLINPALADATAYVSPSKVPTDGKVTIRVVGDSETNTLDKIYVEGPDNTEYVWNASGVPYGIDISAGGEYTVEFGTGVSGWTSSADTSMEGRYHVVGEGVNAYGFFDCSREFYVPEFVVATSALTAVGFAFLNIIRRFSKKR